MADGWPSWNGGLPSWNPAAADFPPSDPELLAGIAAYRRHPWRREVVDPPVLWEEGGSRLLDFGPPDAPPALFVPSLINRAYVFDLAPGHSMLRFLAANGVRPLLLDWGWPGPVERQFTLTDYVAGRLERALIACGRATLVGYCMGGLLAIALAQRRPDLVSALGLLATPWDFQAADPEGASRLGSMVPFLEPVLAFSDTLSVDVLQMLFALLDPGSVADKYRHFGGLDQESERARHFVAIEDWLNDGVPLAAPVARECLAGWYGANTPTRGAWRVAGEVIDPRRLRLPAFVAVPGRDRIVPRQSAAPLVGLIDGSRLHEPHAGHVGMVAGARAEWLLWQPLLAWLHEVAGAG
ncbi:MAG TPA: alpha/beta fold hydrolase [Acetobacteraceae bacterium]|nr:alpha/beta fold hydrolase [Acetobacteraceae bacterium]